MATFSMVFDHRDVERECQEDVIFAPQADPCAFMSLIPETADRSVLHNLTQSAAQSKLEKWQAIAETDALEPYITAKLESIKTDRARFVPSILFTRQDCKRHIWTFAIASRNMQETYIRHARMRNRYTRRLAHSMRLITVFSKTTTAWSLKVRKRSSYWV